MSLLEGGGGGKESEKHAKSQAAFEKCHLKKESGHVGILSGFLQQTSQLDLILLL